MGLGAQLKRSAWPTLPVFQWIEDMGVETKEMLRTFNCGIGMVVIVKPEITENAVSILNSCDEEAWIVGEIVEDKNNQAKVI